MKYRTEFTIAMRRAGLRQKDLVRLTGWSRWTVARWMRGTVPPPEYAWTIVRLHQASLDLAAKLASAPQ